MRAIDLKEGNYYYFCSLVGNEWVLYIEEIKNNWISKAPCINLLGGKIEHQFPSPTSWGYFDNINEKTIRMATEQEIEMLNSIMENPPVKTENYEIY